LLLKGTEGSLKHLFSRNTEDLSVSSLALTLLLYLSLNAGMAGLAVPMGNFIPSMLIGGLVGRILGEIIANSRLEGAESLADAGVYAMVGSAAMLGGFTHMTIAVVVILVEAARDLSLVSPLMLSITISHIVSTALNHHSYDEVLILRKGVPFLQPELPTEMDNHGIVAADLCEELPKEALLPPEAPLETVRKALERWEIEHFPVISDGVCIGLTSRTRLEAAMRVRGAFLAKDATTPRVLEENLEPASLSDLPMGSPLGSDEDADAEEFVNEFCTPTASLANIDNALSIIEQDLAVQRLMDPSPYILMEEMPAFRVYPLFTRTGTSAACVVSRQGEFRGLLSRVNLMAAASNEWRPPKSKKRYRPLP